MSRTAAASLWHVGRAAAPTRQAGENAEAERLDAPIRADAGQLRYAGTQRQQRRQPDVCDQDRARQADHVLISSLSIRPRQARFGRGWNRSWSGGAVVLSCLVRTTASGRTGCRLAQGGCDHDDKSGGAGMGREADPEQHQTGRLRRAREPRRVGMGPGHEEGGESGEGASVHEAARGRPRRSWPTADAGGTNGRIIAPIRSAAAENRGFTPWRRRRGVIKTEGAQGVRNGQEWSVGQEPRTGSIARNMRLYEECDRLPDKR